MPRKWFDILKKCWRWEPFQYDNCIFIPRVWPCDRYQCRNSCVDINMNFYSCDQAVLWMVQSVRSSVRLSVTPIPLCSCHPIIMKFSGVITIEIGDIHAKAQRSKGKVTEVKIQLKFELTDRYERMHTAWSGIEQVPYYFPRPPCKFQGHMGQKIADFDPKWAFPDLNSRLNWPMAIKWCT